MRGISTHRRHIIIYDWTDVGDGMRGAYKMTANASAAELPEQQSMWADEHHGRLHVSHGTD